MKEIMIELLNNILPIIATALSGLIAYVGNKIKKYYDEKYRTETIDNVLKSTVDYVEQVFKDIKGKEKLDKARDVALSRLKNKGIDIDEIELTIIIEAFVRGLK
ncbi:MAG: phage holin, LLH family [Bacilli bacterium]|nr:phage holin, LLH family [Bacilli bacterium]